MKLRLAADAVRNANGASWYCHNKLISMTMHSNIRAPPWWPLSASASTLPCPWYRSRVRSCWPQIESLFKRPSKSSCRPFSRSLTEGGWCFSYPNRWSECPVCIFWLYRHLCVGTRVLYWPYNCGVLWRVRPITRCQETPRFDQRLLPLSLQLGAPDEPSHHGT